MTAQGLKMRLKTVDLRGTGYASGRLKTGDDRARLETVDLRKSGDVLQY